MSATERESVCVVTSDACEDTRLYRDFLTLPLADNNLGAAGAAHLALMLIRNQTLLRLYLNDTGLGADGAALIAAALEKNNTLEELSLGRTHRLSPAMQCCVLRVEPLHQIE